jgi:hypothetical protein
MSGKGEAVLHEQHTSPYSIFVDHFGAVKNKQHSTGAVILHCEDMTPEDKGKLEFAAMLMIIPGPRKPKWSRLYMELIANDFKHYCWDTEGMLIDAAVIEKEDGTLEKLPPFMHRPILVGLDADHPATQWVGEMPEGSQGYRGCFKCKCWGLKAVSFFFLCWIKCTTGIILHHDI